MGSTAIYLIPDVDLRLEFGASSQHGSMRAFEVVGPDLAVGCIARESPSSVASKVHVDGNISPMASVTLSPEARWDASIPVTATHYAFIYPLDCLAGKHSRLVVEYAFLRGDADNGGGAWLDALLYGAFAYFDAAQQLVQVNAVSLQPSTHRIFLDGPFPTSTAIYHALDELERTQAVTLAHLAELGLTHFAWVNPGERPGEQALSDDPRADWPHGAFVYRQQQQPGTPMEAEGFVYFRVALTPPAVAHQRASDGDVMGAAMQSMYRVAAAAAAEQRQLAREVALWRRSPLETWLRRHSLWVVAYYALGCLVYGALEGWPALDTAYFLTATVTTVGYGDFSPASAPARAFTIGYAPLGAIVVLHASITLVSPWLRALNGVAAPWLEWGRTQLERSARAARALRTRAPTLSTRGDPNLETVGPGDGGRDGGRDGARGAADATAPEGARWEGDLYLGVLPGPALALLAITAVAMISMGETPLSAVYFAVITMTTIGFGDVAPAGWVGKVCLTVLMPLSTAALALAIKDATTIGTRDAIRHANFKMQVRARDACTCACTCTS